MHVSASLMLVLHTFDNNGRENSPMLNVTYATTKSIAIGTPIELNIK